MIRQRIFYWAAISLASIALAACNNSSGQGSEKSESAGMSQEAPSQAASSAPAAGASEATQPMQTAETSGGGGGASQPAGTSAAAAETGKAPTYEVKCPEGATSATQCEVGKSTYVGWRTYQANCFVCHGANGVGTTIAPNLMKRFKDHVDYARFKYVVTNGFTGQVGAMPAWKDNPNVMPHIDDLYRYLKARTDGVLPPGRPKRMQ